MAEPIKTINADGTVSINKALLKKRLEQHDNRIPSKAVIAKGNDMFRNINSKQILDAIHNSEQVITATWDFDPSDLSSGIKRGYYWLCKGTSIKLSNGSILGYSLYNSGEPLTKSTVIRFDINLLLNHFNVGRDLLLDEFVPEVIESKKSAKLESLSERPIFVANVEVVGNEKVGSGSEVIWFEW